MAILQVLFFLFLLFSLVYPKNSSPTPTCGNNSFYIQYPFHLQEEGQKPHRINGYQEFNLRCTSEGIAVLNLAPSSGEFNVLDINYFEQKIELGDPGKCLPRRLMNLNLSSDSPFQALLYQNYTFLRCPPGDESRAIGCLSNSTVSMYATSSKSRVEEMKSNGCSAVANLPIPVDSLDQFELNGFDGDFHLEWDISVCQHCPRRSRSKSLGSIILLFLLILCIVALVSMMCGGCLLCFIRHKFESSHNSSTLRPEIAQMPEAATPWDECRIPVSQTEELVVGESRRITGPNSEACPICLEEYQPTERLQSIEGCNHCFHARCLSRWLLSESTCPVCRTSVS
ncbi:putative RING-H2 finger protein ATL21A [Forsythia ovata]|uniref:RING-type E3 ubiquitin transferase n=1 Tax=Forsythia ovata TaxID=205694 RepID=A0ABD1PYE4_9LAMI